MSPVQPDNFPYKEGIAAVSNICLILIVLLFIGCILGFKVMFSYLNLHIFFHTLSLLQACFQLNNFLMKLCDTGLCFYAPFSPFVILWQLKCGGNKCAFISPEESRPQV